MRIVYLTFGLLLSAPVLADQTVILGNFTRQYVLDVKPDCPSSKDENLVAICIDAWIGFEISATKTLSGPSITGRIKAARIQHTLFSSQFFRSLKSTDVLFVMKPILDADTRKLLNSDYYIVESSSPESMYCLDRDPADYGLADRAPVVYVGENSDYSRYCFRLRE